nr:D23 [uncultured bacterium]
MAGLADTSTQTLLSLITATTHASHCIIFASTQYHHLAV